MLKQVEIETKICAKCKKEKSLDDFYERKSRGKGHLSYCKECNKLKKEEWKEKNPDYFKEWAKRNPEKVKKRDERYYQNNPEKVKARAKKYREEHYDERIAYDKKYHAENRKKVSEQNQKWNKEHPDYRKEWQLQNKKHLAEYMRKRRKNNPYIRLGDSIRAMINNSLKKGKNGRHWEELVGYTLDDLKKHLESLFQEGMIWENYGRGKGKWQIDHKIPVSIFNITSVKSKGFKACWALENLRPLWENENNFKRAKLFT